MTREVIDKDSGAILFKKDDESLTLEEAVKRLDILEREYKRLEERIKLLEDSSKQWIKEDSVIWVLFLLVEGNLNFITDYDNVRTSRLYIKEI